MTNGQNKICVAKSMWAVCAFMVVFLCFVCTSAQAALVMLDIGWGFEDQTGLTAAELRDTYHLQEGSIIQVIAYNSADSSAPGATASDNFAWWSTTDDDSTSAEPYDSGHVPPEKDVFLIDTTPEGHEILLTTAVEFSAGDNSYGQDWYRTFDEFVVDTALYDTLYVRIFGATDVEGESNLVVASYWGVGAVTNPNFSYQTYEWFVSDMVAPNLNYFEVIPEPCTLGLFGMGGMALAVWRRRRYAESRRGCVLRKGDGK